MQEVYEGTLLGSTPGEVRQRSRSGWREKLGHDVASVEASVSPVESWDDPSELSHVRARMPDLHTPYASFTGWATPGRTATLGEALSAAEVTLFPKGQQPSQQLAASGPHGI